MNDDILKKIAFFYEHLSALRKFTSGKISAPQFEGEFFNICGRMGYIFPREADRIINDFFWSSSVEDYCSYPEIREEGDLDDEALLRSAKKALEKLERCRKYIRKYMGS